MIWLAAVVAGSSGCWQQWLLAAVVAGSRDCWQQWLLAAVVAGSSGCWQQWLLAAEISDLLLVLLGQLTLLPYLLLCTAQAD
jgi:hypothetical protein